MAFKETFSFLLLAYIVTVTVGAIAIQKREEPQSTTQKVIPLCLDNTPCGWAVYKKDHTKNVDYFMKNRCECETGKECVRFRDDIDVSAFVYNCLVLPEKNEPSQ